MRVIDTDTPEAVLSGVQQQNNFNLKPTAEAFRLLSSSLYSNPVHAIIREVCCNAADSHIAAGTENIPFDVSLPTELNPVFTVRDYGTGLCHEDVLHLYTTYFDSTKQNCQQSTGAMGLGSKSPLGYTNNFNVTSFYNGEKRNYIVYLNTHSEDGGAVPSIAFMNTTETDEPNGLEVSVPCDNDYSRWSTELPKVIFWFQKLPNINGQPGYYYVRPISVRKQLGECTIVHNDIRAGNNSFKGWFVVQGNVAYPLEVSQLEDYIRETYPQQPCEDFHGLDRRTMLSQVNGLLNTTSGYIRINTEKEVVPFQPSRERLQYTTKCKELLINKIRMIFQMLVDDHVEYFSSVENFNDLYNYEEMIRSSKSIFKDIQALYRAKHFANNSNDTVSTELEKIEKSIYEKMGFDFAATKDKNDYNKLQYQCFEPFSLKTMQSCFVSLTTEQQESFNRVLFKNCKIGEVKRKSSSYINSLNSLRSYTLPLYIAGEVHLKSFYTNKGITFVINDYERGVQTRFRKMALLKDRDLQTSIADLSVKNNTIIWGLVNNTKSIDEADLDNFVSVIKKMERRTKGFIKLKYASEFDIFNEKYAPNKNTSNQKSSETINIKVLEKSSSTTSRNCAHCMHVFSEYTMKNSNELRNVLKQWSQNDELQLYWIQLKGFKPALPVTTKLKNLNDSSQLKDLAEMLARFRLMGGKKCVIIAATKDNIDTIKKSQYTRHISSLKNDIEEDTRVFLSRKNKNADLFFSAQKFKIKCYYATEAVRFAHGLLYKVDQINNQRIRQLIKNLAAMKEFIDSQSTCYMKDISQSINARKTVYAELNFLENKGEINFKDGYHFIKHLENSDNTDNDPNSELFNELINTIPLFKYLHQMWFQNDHPPYQTVRYHSVLETNSSFFDSVKDEFIDQINKYFAHE